MWKLDEERQQQFLLNMTNNIISRHSPTLSPNGISDTCAVVLGNLKSQEHLKDQRKDVVVVSIPGRTVTERAKNFMFTLENVSPYQPENVVLEHRITKSVSCPTVVYLDRIMKVSRSCVADPTAVTCVDKNEMFYQQNCQKSNINCLVSDQPPVPPVISRFNQHSHSDSMFPFKTPVIVSVGVVPHPQPSSRFPCSIWKNLPQHRNELQQTPGGCDGTAPSKEVGNTEVGILKNVEVVVTCSRSKVQVPREEDTLTEGNDVKEADDGRDNDNVESTFDIPKVIYTMEKKRTKSKALVYSSSTPTLGNHRSRRSTSNVPSALPLDSSSNRPFKNNKTKVMIPKEINIHSCTSTTTTATSLLDAMSSMIASKNKNHSISSPGLISCRVNSRGSLTKRNLIHTYRDQKNTSARTTSRKDSVVGSSVNTPPRCHSLKKLAQLTDEALAICKDTVNLNHKANVVVVVPPTKVVSSIDIILNTMKKGRQISSSQNLVESRWESSGRLKNGCISQDSLPTYPGKNRLATSSCSDVTKNATWNTTHTCVTSGSSNIEQEPQRLYAMNDDHGKRNGNVPQIHTSVRYLNKNGIRPKSTRLKNGNKSQDSIPNYPCRNRLPTTGSSAVLKNATWSSPNGTCIVECNIMDGSGTQSLPTNLLKKLNKRNGGNLGEIDTERHVSNHVISSMNHSLQHRSNNDLDSRSLHSFFRSDSGNDFAPAMPQRRKL